MTKRLKTETYVVDGEDVKVTRSSGNVFADLGLDNSEELLARANLAAAIARRIKSQKLTQKSAAGLMKLDQPKVSQLVNGKVEGFTTDRLIRFLNDLGCDVNITVSDSREKRGRGNFSFG